MKINRGTGKFRKILFFGVISFIALPSAIFLFRSMLTSFEAKTAQTLAIEKIEYCFEDIYSDDLKCDLQNCVSKYVSECGDFWNFDQQKLFSLIKEKYKIVKYFDCSVDLNSNMIVNIKGQKPFCFINKSQILSESNILFSPDFFVNFDCTNLPNINIREIEKDARDDVLNISLCEFVRKITDFHWQNFEINYVKSSEIRLYPKNTSLRCILLTRNKTFFDCDTINRALQLGQKIASDKQIQKKLKYTSKKILELDLRFKNSIVARAENEVKEGGV